MIKLLKTNFFKLFHSRFYWIVFFIMPFLNLYFSITDRDYLSPHEVILKNGDSSWMAWNFLQTPSYSGHIFYISYIIMAIIALYVGDEFSSGAIRNKIMAGYSRTKLFFGYYISSFIGILIIHIVSESIGLGYCLLNYGLSFYDKYEPYFPDDLPTGAERLKEDLIFFTKLNVMSIIVIAAFVGFVLICMIAIGRKALGFVTALALDVASNIYVDNKKATMIQFFNSNPEKEKQTLMLMSFDPNGFIQALLYQKHFFLCMLCCLLTVFLLILIGIILTNIKNFK